MPSSACASREAARGATLTTRSAPAAFASAEPVVADVGDDDVPGAGVPGDRRGHHPDRAGAGDDDVLAGHGQLQRGVRGVAERVEDRAEVGVEVVGLHPDVGRRG